LNTDPEDVLPILYNIVFAIINGYYMLRWFLQREAMAEALEWNKEEVRPAAQTYSVYDK
jgi:hypothetical protein